MARFNMAFFTGLAMLSCTASEGDEGGKIYENPFPAESAACVARINAFRGTLGLSPYGRWTEADGCAANQARQDAKSQNFHGSFGECDEMAQNECSGFEPIDGMTEECLQEMWDEGPGEDFEIHGHYINMASTDYTKVACGFYVTGNGEVWSVQNYM